MVVWYIGAPGTGNGNPYGIAAATVSLRLRVTYRNADLTDVSDGLCGAISVHQDCCAAPMVGFRHHGAGDSDGE